MPNTLLPNPTWVHGDNGISVPADAWNEGYSLTSSLHLAWVGGPQSTVFFLHYNVSRLQKLGRDFRPEVRETCARGNLFRLVGPLTSWCEVQILVMQVV